MDISKLECVIRKKKKRYQRSILQHVAENILNRNFQAEHPNEKWVTDVTEFKYGTSKKAYLRLFVTYMIALLLAMYLDIETIID